MKKFLTLALLISSLNILAQDSKIFLSLNHSQNMSYTKSFKINAKMGRAWIETEQSDDSFEEPMDSEFRAKIDGLIFDLASSSIVFTKANGQEVKYSDYVEN